jgi:DNA-binding MarR family transcriptional regulator
LSAPPSSQQSIGMVLKRAEQAMLATKNAALKPVGLTLAQYVALIELEQRPAVTGAALARACLVSPQAIVGVVRTLEEHDLVVREPHPRHANVLELHLTPAGRSTLNAGRDIIEPLERRVLDGFSSGDLETLHSLLTRWTEPYNTARRDDD